ncbi:vacuole effluxer Atg22 like-domain-containing protein [Aspergillus arachidicola]|uniref:Autophagy-related protein n=1 Tax=Aspergillus arachidicola TaxID=656916 RepID=A0A5N6XXK6_9EURO|nr:vacuole effluxer Atg22 like-domain-containing protein [Aspergillus arachidicola]
MIDSGVPPQESHTQQSRVDDGKSSEQVFQESTPDKDLEQPIAPDQFDVRYCTTKWEIWAYYAYYIGNNGLSLFNFGPTAFQNLLSQAAGDSGTLYFAGRERSINSIVLLSNGISFAIQVVIFLVIGSFADFGTWRPNILITLSIIAYAIGFGWLGVHTADKWHVGVGLYIVGLIAYQTTLTFWTAAFPGLARNTPEMKAKADAYTAGTISRDEYDQADTIERSRLANIAFYVQSCAEVVILAIIVGIMFGVHVNASEENNNWGLSVLIAFASGVWLLVSLPWFFLEKRRPGQDPQGRNIFVAGLWQLYYAMKQVWRLKQSLLYLVGYFLLGDSLNTTVTVISTLQNSVVSYNTLELTYLLIAGIAAQAVGIYGFWFIQQRFKLGTKTMFNTIAVAIILLDGWGMIGIWTQKFGFHNGWEFWLYQVYYGLFVCPWYSYSQIMISEVAPRGHDFLFFSLFSIVGKTSSFIGPLVSSAIIDATPSGNASMPFYFLFGLSVASFAVLAIWLDLKKSRREQELFLQGKDGNGSGDIRNQSLLGEFPWESVPDIPAPGLNWNDNMLETQSEQRPVAAQARPDPLLPSDLLSPSSNPPVSTSLTAPFGRIEDAALSRLFSPLNASYTGTRFNDYHVTSIHDDGHLSLDSHHDSVSQQQSPGFTNNETSPPNTDAADPLPGQGYPAETLSPEVSGTSRSKRKAGTLEEDPGDGEAMKAIKRQRNTMAARRYRQKGRDRIAELECALRDMEHERNELRLRLARREAEVAALKEMLRR